MTIHDFAIIGAGIAGASLAAELSRSASVLLLEAEDHPGYHSTGRSAAFWEECYGGPEIVPLTLASGAYLRDGGFLSERGALYIGRSKDKDALDAFVDRFDDTGATIERLGVDALTDKIPGLKADWCDAVWEPACADIDVAGLHADYLKRARSGGVSLETRSRVVAIERGSGGWELSTERGTRFFAHTIVIAAGAWADQIAQMAGARPLGIQPLLRTVAQLRADPTPLSTMPLVLDISGKFYFKPEAGRLWLSPHDEVPSQPCDAAADELAVAEAIARLEEVVDWRVEAVERKWAGLRSFAPDRLPVYGEDPQVPGLAWFAGQGGYGIQTSPAAARLTSQLLLGEGPDEMTRAIDARLYSPARFA